MFVGVFFFLLQNTTNDGPIMTKIGTGKSLLGKRPAKAELHAAVNKAMSITMAQMTFQCS